MSRDGRNRVDEALHTRQAMRGAMRMLCISTLVRQPSVATRHREDAIARRRIAWFSALRAQSRLVRDLLWWSVSNNPSLRGNDHEQGTPQVDPES
jgi:hypothetical protein